MLAGFCGGSCAGALWALFCGLAPEFMSEFGLLQACRRLFTLVLAAHLGPRSPYAVYELAVSSRGENGSLLPGSHCSAK